MHYTYTDLQSLYFCLVVQNKLLLFPHYIFLTALVPNLFPNKIQTQKCDDLYKMFNALVEIISHGCRAQMLIYSWSNQKQYLRQFLWINIKCFKIHTRRLAVIYLSILFLFGENNHCDGYSELVFKCLNQLNQKTTSENMQTDMYSTFINCSN